MEKFNIGLILYPGVTQLDLTGPAEVFGRVPQCDVHLIWKTLDPVATEHNWGIIPTQTFTHCVPLDVICVPGGRGQIALMDDEEVLSFIQAQSKHAKWVTSVCTGALLLGAAGLLKGYRATSHWMSRDQLALFGAIPVNQRVVCDRNRITGGGVTAGIDFALKLISVLFDEATAQSVQLAIEYDPSPPFCSGRPEQADEQLVRHVIFVARKRQEARLVASIKAAGRLDLQVHHEP